jgi:predicted O-methyltransferase YrrM
LLKELANVVRTARVKHFFSAFRCPLHTVRAIKYHYRRVPENDFVKFLANRFGCPSLRLDDAYNDLEKHASRWRGIKERLDIYPKGYGLQMTRELNVLYILVRVTKPNRVIETGVSAGASSAYILSALNDNNNGKLFSIDLPPENLPAGKDTGWVVPEILRGRWSLRIGDAKNILVPLLKEIGSVDLFIHDSLHTYEHMIWEYRRVWDHLTPGGLFLSHDVGANDAFFHFMKEKNIAWKDYRVFHVLGGFQKKG